PIVLASYGIGPQGVGFYIMAIPISYIVGNFLTSRLITRLGERRMMQLGQFGSASGLLLVVGLGLAGLKTPLAFVLPLLLLGVGHGLLMPPALAGTLGLVPALAGTAAALAGVSQQLMGALGAYFVGLVSHDGAVNLSLLMLAFMLASLSAQVVLHRR
ncbi:MAG: MFS transporter, partial [Burkholderiaceae bacterium]